MMNSASIKKADVLIEAVNEMMADEISVARLDDIVATARQMSDAGQYVEACNVLGMVAALRGDSFDVERRFKAAIQRGGNDAWTLGNYATALNHLVGVIQKNKHCGQRPAEQGELERPSQLVGAASGHMNDIAERKYMDEAWSTASDRDFRSLVESLPDNVARWDTKGRYVYINPALERTLAPAKVDVIGKTKSEAFPDGRFALVEKTIAQVVATGESVRLVRQLVPAENGEMRLHDITLVPEFDVTGKIVSAVCLGRDMTDFYRMQEVIAAREHEFRSLAENLPDNIIRWDCQGRYLYINPTHERLLGIPAMEIVGREISDTHESVKAAIAQVVATGQPALCVRQQVIDAQGKLVFHEVRLIPERDSAGRIVSVLGMGRDMTDIYRMQDAIAAREQEFRSLAESSSDFIVRNDRNYCLRYLNAALVKLLGLSSAEEVIGKCASDVWPDGRFDKISHAVEQATESGSKKIFELTVPRATGGVDYHQICVVPERDAAGTIIGTIAFGRDITELKSIERDLEESRTQLRGLIAQREGAREEERKNIAREVHDELGQILTGLKMKIAVIDLLFAAESEPLHAHMQEAMILMESAIGVARNISSALRPVELEQGIVAALEWQAGRFRTFTGMQCNVHIGDAEMQPDDNASIAIFRIVQESLTNVARHACASNVVIRLEREADSYVLKISDDGQGFDTAMKRTNAFGLVGLRERALMLGGTLCINSSPGLGTEIVVRIPLVN